ncbi:MAG: glycosyltransferase family A protein [Bacteroidota bacterium]
MLSFYIIIPAHNEEAYLSKTLQSLCEQTLLPKRLVVVNDHSTDGTQHIIDQFSEQYSFVSGITIHSEDEHVPGAKVVRAFYRGKELLDDDYDVICKFDADLEFPTNYLEVVAGTFLRNSGCGLAGGFCYIEHNGDWVLEGLTNTDHIRGALKAYKKECFEQIGGLKPSMGWDTVDELLARYHGWQVQTIESLHVKHLKPTGATYSKASGFKQGQAFGKMRYGFVLTAIASIKLASRKRSLAYFWHCLRGFFSIKKDHLVSTTEGQFIRQLRWRGIRKKIF